MAISAVACSSGEEERGLEALDTPAFAPEEAAAAASSTVPASTSNDAPITAPTTTTPGATADTVAAAPPGGGDAGGSAAPPDRQVASFDDPVGDATGGLDEDPPAWTDLAGARLVRNGDAYGLSVRLGGGTVPQRAPAGRTMNVATFFDADGDGTVDFEIWANLGPEGWGAAYYDNTDRTGGFGEESNVTVVLRDQSLELIFPDILLDRAERFRFSLASEYGGLDVLGSDYARRDDAPDGGQAVAFPP
ncbi:MAG TPA: hypothetical protein VFU14_08855 [Acidimicrobiales bacterium]|nr:hypothetical protein [Acidimicrobiales bacterium]